MMREELGLEESGLSRMIRAAHSLLEQISFFTAGPAVEARAWSLRRGQSAWHAAGRIHTDIQDGFVKAEVIGWQELVDAGGYAPGPRPRPAADRGPRLRDERRRRAHRQAHVDRASGGPGLVFIATA